MTKELRTKLAEYEDLEAKGLLVRLPCKVGEYVYVIGRQVGEQKMFGDVDQCCKHCKDRGNGCEKSVNIICPYVVIPVKLDIFEISKQGIISYEKHYEGNFEIENYYTTKEEAEKALAEMEEQQ